MKAFAKVMRSYDYCHFEIALEREVADGDLDAVNELRKEAAILVDEAVRQYKIAKDKEKRRESQAWQINELIEKIKRFEAIPENERTIEQTALLRSSADRAFWKDYDEDWYGYGEDPERDHHFSMLRRFKETRVKAG